MICGTNLKEKRVICWQLLSVSSQLHIVLVGLNKRCTQRLRDSWEQEVLLPCEKEWNSMASKATLKGRKAGKSILQRKKKTNQT